MRTPVDEPPDADVAEDPPFVPLDRPAKPNAATAEKTAESVKDTATATRVIRDTDRMPFSRARPIRGRSLDRIWVIRHSLRHGGSRSIGISLEIDVKARTATGRCEKRCLSSPRTMAGGTMRVPSEKGNKMSVMMTLSYTGDPDKLEAFAKDNHERLIAITDKAKEHGAISHHFYASNDGLMVVDEWPSEDAFQAFFAASPEISSVMQDSGATSRPTITFWRKLETGDEI
jgi:hypothetical protein